MNRPSPLPGLMLAVMLGLAGQAAAAPAASATAAPAAVPADCRVKALASWQGHAVKWTGECRNGLADGLGALRAYQGSGVAKSFYGRMNAGQPAFGVLETAAGYEAGPFEAGEPVKGSEREVLIKAFREAAAGARTAAERFERQGNSASARHYRRVADELSAQMD